MAHWLLRNMISMALVVILYAPAVSWGATKSMTARTGTIVLLHGIGKSRLDMVPLEKYLKKHGYRVLNWNYPSTRKDLDALAVLLHKKLDEDGATTYSFVTHSMGGIVVRTYLSKFSPKNVSRFVMIAPPNQGAFLADLLGGFTAFKLILGPAGQQLRRGENGKCADAGVPECEFGILAGGAGLTMGMNPIVPGDNDLTVSVEATMLPGARDFAVLPYPHPVIQMMPRTCRYVENFLRTGEFGATEKEKRRVVQKNEAAP